MPQRNFRVTLENNTALDLTLKDAHLCHGDWTPGGWSPSATIASQDSKGWQSESAGIGTGTEGWVKYNLNDPVNPDASEQVYVHWQVPYIGTPVIPGYDQSSSQVSLADVTPHCDAPEGGGGNTFGIPPPKHYLKFAGASQGPTEPTVDEVLVAYSNPFSTVAAFLFGYDSHIYVTLFLAEIGSVRQAIPRSYDPSQGLRGLANRAKTTSVRRMLAL
jgi:hypothetical protein